MGRAVADAFPCIAPNGSTLLHCLTETGQAPKPRRACSICRSILPGSGITQRAFRENSPENDMGRRSFDRTLPVAATGRDTTIGECFWARLGASADGVERVRLRGIPHPYSFFFGAHRLIRSFASSEEDLPMDLFCPGAESRYTGIAMVGLCGTVIFTLGTLLGVPSGWWIWVGGAIGAMLVFGAAPRGRWNWVAYGRGVLLALTVAVLCPLVFPRATPLLVGVVIMLYASIVTFLARSFAERR